MKRLNKYYYHYFVEYYSRVIPKGMQVLHLGCKNGKLLNALSPSFGLGICDSEQQMIHSKEEFPALNFNIKEHAKYNINRTFDYIIISDYIGDIEDVQYFFRSLQPFCHTHTKLIISYYSFLWEPILLLAEIIGLKEKKRYQNWLSKKDIINLLDLDDYEFIKVERKLLFPLGIPFLSFLLNRIIANLPLINTICLSVIFTARPKIKEKIKEYSVSIIIPARNEKENIELIINNIPMVGRNMEFIFIEGLSTDGTYEEILRVKKVYVEKNIILHKQSEKGKANAVKEGFEKANGEILIIFDADMTVSPDEIPKIYNALRDNKGEFINACRLIYPMEQKAMRLLNIFGNKFFSTTLSYLLTTHLKDTLCGTKALFKKHYEIIKREKKFSNSKDPFGDFDLLLGATKANLKIVEVPVRYKKRKYGKSKISRFAHGWMLLKICINIAKELKFT